MQQLRLPISYSVGAKMSFADMGHYEPGSKYFVYEADEFDRNFLAFHPFLSIITGIDWDHPDIYPTRESYNEAFCEFLNQSSNTVLWNADTKRLGVTPQDHQTVLDEADASIDRAMSLAGLVNRQNAWEVVQAVHMLTNAPIEDLVAHLNEFPGVSRRFEQIIPNLYTDYAHTPPKIRGALQLAHEVAGDNVVVVYEGLHNTRQHFIKDDLKHLFDSVKQLYIVPSYLAREDKSLALLTPEDLKALLDEETQKRTEAMELNDALESSIQEHLSAGDLVLCVTAGGGHSLDEWLRETFGSK
jgi:UDP-N-acetylmuramate--alanine ligase